MKIGKVVEKWTIQKKKPKQGRGGGGGVGAADGGRFEDMEFPRVLKKENMEIPGVNLKEVEFPRVFKEKLKWNFHSMGLSF